MSAYLRIGLLILENDAEILYSAASIPGRILPALLSDHIGQFNTMSVVAMASGLSILVFWLPLEVHHNHAGILAFGAFFGFVSGGFISLLTPCIVALSNGRVEDLGARMGAFLVVLAFAYVLLYLPILKTSEAWVKDENN